ncbi:MAG: TetR/AcrR family transcriptional regulator [Ruminococcus sp.]|nr:TetR/AcrR family transcriptional regulator [Ruminococcus sp.]
MNKSESKYFNTAQKMDEALFVLIEKKDFEFITVKDICAEAGVNRSTFYLHYETIGDLLDECSAYIMRRFESYFHTDARERLNIETATLEELNFISPRYLILYLEFVRDNKHFFHTVVKHHRIFATMNQAKAFFEEIFVPILRRYRYPEKQHHYVLMYYLNGMMAVITEWLEADCNESPEELAKIIMRCVIPNETDQ